MFVSNHSIKVLLTFDEEFKVKIYSGDFVKLIQSQTEKRSKESYAIIVDEEIWILNSRDLSLSIKEINQDLLNSERRSLTTCTGNYILNNVPGSLTYNQCICKNANAGSPTHSSNCWYYQSGS